MTPEVPNTPTTPIVGQMQQAQQDRKNAADARSQALQKMADNPIFRRIYYKTIQKGALATFNYLHWKHDPYPLILCSSIYSDGRVAGVNLHYLTFRYIKYLIEQYCGKTFSYQLIKNNLYIHNAFRTYKRDGIRTAKLLDCDFLKTLLGTVRSFNPSEIEAIRQEIQKQLTARMNQTAEQLSQEYSSIISPNPNDPRYQGTKGYEAKERFGEPNWSGSKFKPTRDDARFNPANLQPPAE
jgi:hypothetical protein